MKVITVAAPYKLGYFKALEESAYKFGYELVALGLGQPWRGFGWRLKLVLEYLSQIDPDEIVLVVDAYDVVLLRPAHALKTKFETMNKPFICGAYRSEGLLGFMQNVSFEQRENSLPQPYTSICAGTWIARAGTALDLFREYMPVADKMDDQRLFNQIYNNQGARPLVTPDSNFDIFCTVFPSLDSELNPEDRVSIRGGELYSGLKNAFPFVLHGMNGARLDDLICSLGIYSFRPHVDYCYIVYKFCYHLGQFVSALLGR